MRVIQGHIQMGRQTIEQARVDELDVCRAYDVPPWIVLSWYPRPRFPRIRWALRRWWKFV